MANKKTTIDDLAIAVNAGFKGVDKQFEGVNKRFDGVDKRFDGVDKRLKVLEDGQEQIKLRFNFYGDCPPKVTLANLHQ